MCVDFVYLASASPRRRELLLQIGVPCRVVQTSVDEAVQTGETPLGYVARVAAAKAAAGWQSSRNGPDAPVLGADTAVVFAGRILGKPSGRQDAADMLRQLSGSTHEVLTAVVLRSQSGAQSRISRSEVTFRAIAEPEVQAYWDSGEPRDKAGAYAIQGRAAVFVANLRGSYSGVMGLPLCETAELLEAAGIAHWQPAVTLSR